MHLSDPLNVNLILGENILVNIKPNSSPVLANPVSSQIGFVNQPFFLAIPSNTFADLDLHQGDRLRYMVTLANGGNLPQWLVYDSITEAISGTPLARDIDNISIAITAIDQAGKSATTNFQLNIAIDPEEVVLPSAPQSASLFGANTGNNIFRGSAESDFYDLTVGEANIIKGTPGELDRDIVLGFGLDDAIYVIDSIVRSGDLAVRNTDEHTILELSGMNPLISEGDPGREQVFEIIFEGDHGDSRFDVKTVGSSTLIFIASGGLGACRT
jgi:hypothetical protein